MRPWRPRGKNLRRIGVSVGWGRRQDSAGGEVWSPRRVGTEVPVRWAGPGGRICAPHTPLGARGDLRPSLPPHLGLSVYKARSVEVVVVLGLESV